MTDSDPDAGVYRVASDHIADVDSDWARLVAQIGACGYRPKPVREPYEALVRAVAHQQLRTSTAERIVARVIALCPDQRFPSPAQLLARGPDSLRACGLSARKVATIHAIAAGARDGLVPPRAVAEQMPDEALIERLVTLPGIGRWSVEMLLIFSLGRLDVLPLDDFGVREGYRRMKGLEALPERKLLAEVGRACSPYRTIAAWYLWRVASLPGYARRT